VTMNSCAGTVPQVDAHHHVWQLARGDYGWLTPDLAAIHRDFTLDDLAQVSARAGVASTVLVQAAPTVAETEFLLATAARSNGLVRGVVGWVDLAAQDAAATMSRLAQDPLLKSIRPMLQDIPDPEWILRTEVDTALAAVQALGLRFDALVKVAQLPAVLRMLERHPDLAVVIDHGAKPAIAAGAWHPWAGLIDAVARHPRVHCKISGLATEAGPDWTADALRPWVEHLLQCFGPGRLMWGSDWPVVNLAGGYARWLAATDALLRPLDVIDRSAILGGNAARFYGLGLTQGSRSNRTRQ
jgi:L-fuconolactonase